MIAWLLIILGFIISCLIIPPIGPICYLIGVIIFLVIVKIIKASASTSTYALNAIGNKISGKTKKVSFTYSSWFILFVTLIFFPLLGGLIAFFESLGVESDSISFCVVITSFLAIGLFSFVYRKYAEKLYKKQLYSIVKEHFNILSEKYKELVYVGDYGETIYDKWYEELDRFIDGVIKKQKSAFTLSNDELKKRIIKIFDKIYNQTLNQK